jgi:integrase/recombinase XerD
LSVFASGFLEVLLRRGYRPGTAAKELQLMVHLSRWMAARDLKPADLGGVESERFLRERRATGRVQLASARALVPLLGYLRGLGVAPPAGSREAPTPAGALLEAYANVGHCSSSDLGAHGFAVCGHARTARSSSRLPQVVRRCRWH